MAPKRLLRALLLLTAAIFCASESVSIQVDGSSAAAEPHTPAAPKQTADLERVARLEFMVADLQFQLAQLRQSIAQLQDKATSAPAAQQAPPVQSLPNSNGAGVMLPVKAAEPASEVRRCACSFNIH